MKKWIVTIGLLAVLGFFVLNVLAFNHARAMMHFTYGGDRTSKPEALSLWQKAGVLFLGVNIPRPRSSALPADLADDCSTLKIKVPDDITLDTWYCDRGRATPLVILFHGYSSEKTALLEEAEAFLGLGCSVLLVDFRGSGGSSEAYTTIGLHEAEDVSAVFRFAEENLPHDRIVLFGTSMGAVAILRAMHQDEIKPDTVILEAVFDTMLNTVRNRFYAMGVPSFPNAELLVFWGGRQWGFNGFKHNPVDYAASVDCPALFMHGEDDPRATLAEGRNVYAAVPGPKEWVQFEHTGHESYVATHPSTWRDAVERVVGRQERTAGRER